MGSLPPDALELEGVCGWTGRFSSTLLCHPTQDAVFIAALGAAVVIGDVNDPHAQRFLHGHDAEVSALDVSASGRFIASGQLRSTQVATGDASVIAWDAARGVAIYTFFGLGDSVSHVAFSPDERFLAAAGGDNTLAVWDMSTGEQVYSKKQGTGGGSPRGIHFIAWGPVTQSAASRRGSYTLAFTIFDRVHVAALEFDFRVMRYAATPAPAQLPATGFVRTYTSGAIDASGGMLLAGTAAGELAVYSLLGGAAPLGAPAATQPLPVFKTALAASGNGVHAIRCVRAPLDASGRTAVYLGGGDGSIRCFTGRAFDWVCAAEARLPARVVSISIGASGTWLLCGTSAGQVFRLAWVKGGGGGAEDLQRAVWGGGGRGGFPPPTPVLDLLSTSHTGPLSAVSFHPTVPEALVTAGADASLRLWSLNDYTSSWTMGTATAGPSPTTVWVATPFAAPPPAGGARGGAGAGGGAPSLPGIPCDVYAGFTDGSLRAFSVLRPGVEVGSSAGGRAPSEGWRVNAHRGGVTCVTGNRAVVITGGGDGRVCVWARASHDLLLSFNDHTKPIVNVLVDARSPEVVYSAGADRTIVTYNLRAERRVRMHSLPPADAHACTFTAMTQLTHPACERELLAGTSDGRVFVFDPDVPETHAGALDILALLIQHAGACAAAAARGDAGGAAGGGIGICDPPVTRPGQARPELRITALAASPSSRFVALVTACGRLVVLSIPALAAMGDGGARGSAGAAAAVLPPLARRGPVNAGTYTDLSGTVRPALVSQAAVMKLAAAFHNGRCAYTGLSWAPDEKQLVAVASDGLLSVFNWYGAL